jgi:hypothetical protein
MEYAERYTNGLHQKQGWQKNKEQMNTSETKKRSERNSRESILPPKHQEIPKKLNRQPN